MSVKSPGPSLNLFGEPKFLKFFNIDFANTAKQSKSHLLSAHEGGKKEDLPINVPDGVVFYSNLPSDFLH